MKTLLTILNAKFIQSSLALRCLETACAHQGVAVSVAEYTINQNAYDILRHIASFRAEAIGFSCYIWNIEMTCHIIDLVKEVFPDVKIFVGGPEVSYTARQILEDYPHIDYVLQGEGEEMLPAFLQELERGGDG
ncbi:radical SAM protein, partial [uncultured Megasphaera sp.]